MSYFKNFTKEASAPGLPNFDISKPYFQKIREGDIGLELEMEASNSFPWAELGDTPCPVTNAKWQAKEDHSLRNGVEYVLSKPCDISSVRLLLEGLYKDISDFKTKLRLSNRCSTHVHLNFTGQKLDKITNFIVLWGLFEKVLIDWWGEKRKTNHFCLSIEDSPATVEEWEKFLRGRGWNVYDGMKYSALNLLRMRDLGSIEIRCGDATEDIERLVAWAELLWSMREFSVKSVNDPSFLPSIVSDESPAGLFVSLLHPLTGNKEKYFGELFEDEDAFNRKCYSGLRDVLHLCHGIPWGDWRETLDKVYIPNPFEKQTKSSRLDPVFPNEIPPQPPLVARNGRNFHMEVLANRAIRV